MLLAYTGFICASRRRNGQPLFSVSRKKGCLNKNMLLTSWNQTVVPGQGVCACEIQLMIQKSPRKTRIKKIYFNAMPYTLPDLNICTAILHKSCYCEYNISSIPSVFKQVGSGRVCQTLTDYPHNLAIHTIPGQGYPCSELFVSVFPSGT